MDGTLALQISKDAVPDLDTANTEFDRDGTVTDVANLTCFLVSDNAHYITGQTFNVDGGRCEECLGDGFKKVEMQFMADIFLECDSCKGKRFNKKILDIKHNDKKEDLFLAVFLFGRRFFITQFFS